MKICAVDIFCGVGGITHGFIRAGIPVLAGYDIDESCKFAYEKNNNTHFFCKNIEDITPAEILNLYPVNSIKVLIGCAPCQPFSRYTYRYKKQGEHKGLEKKYALLNHFARLVEHVAPEVVSMENVPDLYKKKYEQYTHFLDILLSNGYHIYENVVNCAEYGVPQFRKRLVVIASKVGPIKLIQPTHRNAFLTVRDTISDLPSIQDGESCKNDPLHKSSKLSVVNKKRILATPYGGGWKDWPEDLRLECHKKKSGRTYASVYGRMKWDEPSPTITTQSFGLGNGRFGHPVQNRAISLREAALLQTFPIDYQFNTPGNAVNTITIGRHIGNAVPVRLAEVIALSIKNGLDLL